jgi:hypothetical protein
VLQAGLTLLISPCLEQAIPGFTVGLFLKIMAIILPIAKIGLSSGSGSGNDWKVSFDLETGAMTIGYGPLFYNGKFFTTNDLESGTESTGFNDTQVFINPIGQYVYVQVFNATSQPTETTEDLKIKIDITTAFDTPNNINENAPLIEYIPLAFVELVDDTVVVHDLRATFIVNNFSILA